MKFENKETEELHNTIALFYDMALSAPDDEIISEKEVKQLLGLARLTKKRIFIFDNK